MNKLIVLTIVSLTIPSFSATFYLDPNRGSMSNDGSSSHPWTTVQEVLDSNLLETYVPFEFPYHEGDPLILVNEGAPVKAGDTLICRTGYYGPLHISRKFNTDYITILAAIGHTPTFKNIRFTGARFWRIQGLTITPSSAPEYESNILVSIEWHNYSGPSTYITVEDCYLYSVENASSWNMQQWDTLSCTAVSSGGKHIIIRNNYCKNVNFGISSSGDSSLVEYNIIENFAGDGLRGLGDYNTFQYNIVKNCYDVNGNHDDGFQSWSVGAGGEVGTDTVWGVVLRGNTIIEYEDPKQPYKGTLQGIGCFDGFYANWIVENNVVIVEHYHGITLSGAVNCRIINNTVIDRDTSTEISPWIRVGDHKDGSQSEGCVVRNNIYYRTLSMDSQQTEDHNLRVRSYDQNFVNFSRFDVRLKEGSSSIDSGSSEMAPVVDIRGVSRPQGDSYDIGAYEYLAGEGDLLFSPLTVFPNPFNIFTDIGFSLYLPSNARLEVFNLSGAKVRELVNERRNAGIYSERFERENLPSGVYFVVLKVNDQIESKKVILIK